MKDATDILPNSRKLKRSNLAKKLSYQRKNDLWLYCAFLYLWVWEGAKLIKGGFRMEDSEYKMDNDLFKKEIDLIQDIIKRMAANSFLVKGWMITLVMGTVVLGRGGEMDIPKLVLSIIPLLIFWILDAYFLKQERLFRKLYNWVIDERPRSNKLMFDMNVGRFIKDVPGVIRIMFSETLFVFYGITFLLIIIYALLLLLKVKI